MDIRAFENSPEVSLLLVRLYEGQKLYKLAADKKPLAKAELTSAVSELLTVELSPRETELLTDVLIGLMRQAERDLRAAMAERICTMDSVPFRLALHLANDEIAVARSMLTRCPVLSDLDLIYIVKSQGFAYAQAVARRSNLSPQLVDFLADTRDEDTVIALTENERAQLTKHAISVLVDMSKSSDKVARPLLARPEISADMARALYEHVGQEVKSYIRTFYGVTDPSVEEALDDVLLEFAESTESEFMPDEQKLRLAQKFADMGMLNLNIMLEVLHRGQIKSFIAMFSRFTGLSARRVHDFLKQPCPKGLAIACRAFGIQKGDFSRIYLMTHKMRSADRIVNHTDMLEILAYFDKVRPETAMRIVHNTAR